MIHIVDRRTRPSTFLRRNGKFLPEFGRNTEWFESVLVEDGQFVWLNRFLFYYLRFLVGWLRDLFHELDFLAPEGDGFTRAELGQGCDLQSGSAADLLARHVFENSESTDGEKRKS